MATHKKRPEAVPCRYAPKGVECRDTDDCDNCGHCPPVARRRLEIICKKWGIPTPGAGKEGKGNA